MDEINADLSLRAVVLTGTGKAFVSGGDLAYMKDVGSEEAMKYIETIMEAFWETAAFSKIFIRPLAKLSSAIKESEFCSV